MVQLTIGAILMLVAPVVGLLPGPGGIFVFAGGLVLVLRNSRWAQVRVARAKRRWPRLGHATDLAMRRRSAIRRRARSRASAR